MQNHIFLTKSLNFCLHTPPATLFSGSKHAHVAPIPLPKPHTQADDALHASRLQNARLQYAQKNAFRPQVWPRNARHVGRTNLQYLKKPAQNAFPAFP